MITHEVSAALGRALQAIDGCGMRYALAGGLAVSAWAKKLDASIGTDEVSARLASALREADKQR